MLLRKRKAREQTAASTLDLYYASDVHGSEQCWRKFLGAGRFYGVQALIMGGDLTGKAIVPITVDGPSFRVRFLGEDQSGSGRGGAREAGGGHPLQRHVPLAGERRGSRAGRVGCRSALGAVRARDGRGAAALDRPGGRAHVGVRHRRLRHAGERRSVELRRGDRRSGTRHRVRRAGRAGRRPRDDLLRVRQPDAVEQPAGARRGRPLHEAPGPRGAGRDRRRRPSSTCTCRRTTRGSTPQTR